MSNALRHAQTALMRAHRSGDNIEEARREFETIKALNWIKKNQDKLQIADLDLIITTITNLKDN